MKKTRNCDFNQLHLRSLGVRKIAQAKALISKLVFAASLATSLTLAPSAIAKTIHLPNDPISPTDDSECLALFNQYSAIEKELHALVQQYLDQMAQLMIANQSAKAVIDKIDEINVQLHQIHNRKYAADARCREKVSAYKAEQAANHARESETQRQQAIAQQQAQQQSPTPYRVQQGLNTYKQVQQGRTTLNTAKNLFESPKTTLGGFDTNSFVDILKGLATQITAPSVKPEDIKKYDTALAAAGMIADKTITNPVATLVSSAAMEKLRLQQLGMLNTLGEVGRDIREFGAGDVESGSQSSGSNWTWSPSTQGVPVSVPEVSVKTSDPDPLGKFLESVDTKSWDAQVSDFQSGLRQSMGSKSGQIVEAMNWIDQNQSQRMQNIGNSYASARAQVEEQSPGINNFENPSSTGVTNVNLTMASTNEQTGCQAAQPYLEQANVYKKAINQIKAQESDYRSGYGSANIDQYLAKLKEGIRQNEAEAAKLCPR